MNKLSFYLSLLKYSIIHPNSGIQIFHSARQVKEDRKSTIHEYDIKPVNITEAMTLLFPEQKFSLDGYKQTTSQLTQHMESFFTKLETEEYPSQKKPYPTNYSLDYQSGLFLYSLCKIMKPAKIVETGIAYGFSSTFILQALYENKKGILYSIDSTFRPWESKQMIGSAIPKKLLGRQKFIFGSSSDKLKNLLESLDGVDIFFHDSLHTFKNMSFEFQVAWPFINQNGFLLSDDVMSNNAFYNFFTSQNLTPVILSQKTDSKSFMGILRKK